MTVQVQSVYVVSGIHGLVIDKGYVWLTIHPEYVFDEILFCYPSFYFSSTCDFLFSCTVSGFLFSFLALHNYLK